MATAPTLSTFYVGWSEDNRTYQLLGTYDGESAKSAVEQAARNHGKGGHYLVLPYDRVTLFDVAFDMVPKLTKVEERVPLPVDSPVIIP